MVILLLVIGICGLVAGTILFPLIARLFYHSDHATDLSHEPPRSIAVLIPAADEAQTIGVTLRSVFEASSGLQALLPETAISIFVGVDGAVDNTAMVARWNGAEVVESDVRLGKWRMLERLVEAAGEVEWIAFVDAGITWPKSLLVELLTAMMEPSVMAIAPAYRNAKEGIFESLLWRLEARLKNAESKVGGPVAVHGATVFYRRKELIAALAYLGPKSWLNDDVVLPLSLHTLFPEKTIRYVQSIAVDEQSVSERNSREFFRRQRMLIGNIEWIKGLFPTLWSTDRVAGLLALRRVFRLLWGYWAVALLSGSLVIATQLAGMTALVAAAVAIGLTIILSHIFRNVRALFDAALVSLLTPFFIFGRKGVGWK